ncbi:hypothetical protein NDU88_003147 [Pleurodeles waltl]|uniref:Uncharacterized protein n=1 Tax=Pleurodeles waltl TaxID=8319 RepID=A0AAV7VCK0_PLEWA|nr:hypothetical protein NDU88_003147 [Pleurodeles waltl]
MNECDTGDGEHGRLQSLCCALSTTFLPSEGRVVIPARASVDCRRFGGQGSHGAARTTEAALLELCVGTEPPWSSDSHGGLWCRPPSVVMQVEAEPAQAQAGGALTCSRLPEGGASRRGEGAKYQRDPETSQEVKKGGLCR